MAEVVEPILGTADAEISTSEGRISFHKLILSSKSEKFRELLSSSAQTEDSKTIIKTNYFSYNCIFKLIRFAYCGKLDFDEDLKMATELISAADYFVFPDLKNICLDILMEIVDVPTVFGILEIASKFEFQNLMEKCVSILKTHPQITESDECSNFLTQHPKVGGKIMKMLLTTSSDDTETKIFKTFFNSAWFMFMRKEFTDVVLKCSTGSIHCHKIVLVANSKVFKQLIQEKAETLNRSPKKRKRDEVEKCELKIKDFSQVCMLKLINSLYTGEISEKDIDVDLYMAADHFEVTHVKQECEKIFVNKKVTIDNVLELLRVAWVAKCYQLIDNCIPTLINNVDVMKSDEYRDVVLADQDLSLLVMMKFTEKYLQK